MAAHLTPQLGESPDPFYKALEILNGLPILRIPQEVITMMDAEPCAKGGQATVTIGNLTVPEELRTLLTDEVVIKRIHVDTQIPEERVKEDYQTKLAIKKFKWGSTNGEKSAKAFKSFVNELSLIATLSHRNVAPCVGFVEDVRKGVAWIVSLWEPNGNVREFLQSGEWEIPERISLIQDVAAGVEYLHSREPPICHGDLKSLNILVNSSYRAVITDFGSARVRPCIGVVEKESVFETSHPGSNHDTPEGLTSAKVKLNGTTLELTLSNPGFSIRWTAPEVLADGVQDLASDMWAVGWICWEIITGRLPFDGLTRMESIIVYVTRGELPALRTQAQLSQVLNLCSLMSDCWIGKPVKRIDASTFQRKVKFLPSTVPSSNASGDMRVRSATLLNELGALYNRQHNYEMAKSHYQSAADVAAQTEDQKAKAMALHGLGYTYCARSEYQNAEQAFRKAHKIHSRIGDDLGAANALHGLGEVYGALSEYQKAEQAFREAHEIYSRIGDDLGAAKALHGLGEVHGARSEYQNAEQAFKEAHKIHSHIGDDLGAANALHGLGEVYGVRSEYQKAEQAFGEAHKIHSRIGNDLGAANALHSLGHTYWARLEYQQAEQGFREAHEIYSRIGNDLGVASALDGLGEVYHACSDYQKAEQTLREAHQIHSRIGDDLGAANALHGLGKIYSVRSEYQKAEQAFSEAHKIHSHIGNHVGAADALDGLGNTYRARSEYQKAEQAFREAHKIHSCIGNDRGAANTLDGLGDI